MHRMYRLQVRSIYVDMQFSHPVLEGWREVCWALCVQKKRWIITSIKTWYISLSLYIYIYTHIYRVNVLPATRWLLLAGSTAAQPNERPPVTVNPFRMILLFVWWDIFVVCWSPTIVHVNTTDVSRQSTSAPIIWQIDSWVPCGNRNVMWRIILSSSLLLFSVFFSLCASFTVF